MFILVSSIDQSPNNGLPLLKAGPPPNAAPWKTRPLTYKAWRDGPPVAKALHPSEPSYDFSDFYSHPSLPAQGMNTAEETGATSTK